VEFGDLVNGTTLKAGDAVQFRLKEIIYPDLDQVFGEIESKLDVSGQVTFLSDSGGEKDRFAIINVAGIGSPLIVAVDQLQSSLARSGDADGEGRDERHPSR